MPIPELGTPAAKNRRDLLQTLQTQLNYLGHSLDVLPPGSDPMLDPVLVDEFTTHQIAADDDESIEQLAGQLHVDLALFHPWR